MSVGLRRLIQHGAKEPRAGLSGAQYRTAMDALSPSARRTLQKIAHGKAVTAAESRRLADDLRRQGADGGEAEPGLSEAGKMWARVYARQGRLKPEVLAQLGDEIKQHQGNSRARSKGVEMWKSVYRKLGVLKEDS